MIKIDPRILGKNILATLVLAAIVAAAAPLSVLGQTQIKMPKNKYKIEDDVKIGREAVLEVEKQMPILNDAAATRYVSQVGERLVASIPADMRQPQFQYTFKIVNARDINAFALPGGPMYVNRGMIEAARNEGEMAGVMAHEISHVVLRHGTAQATKQSNPWNQILGIGAILGGAVLAGQTGAQLGQIFAAGYFLRYSREYETQADTLGAQIMARAGYDPNDLANMFKTIEKESGGGSGGPDWLSSHPNPANRYKNIENEARLLRISGDPIKNTPGFEQTKRKLQSMPRAKSMAEIEKEGKVQNNGGTTTSPTANGVYKSRVDLPSTRYKVYKSSNFLTVNIPNNWDQMQDSGDGSIYFSPNGGYGKDGITHGALMGMYSSRNARTLSAIHEEYVSGILSGNNYLRKQGSTYSSTMANRSGFATKLVGISPVSGKSEVVTVYSVLLSNGSLLYLAAVSPEAESASYSKAFSYMRTSMTINDK